ncbi:aldehyde dehydrogenase family protein [Microbacterium sp. STN6]|uniref:aldehyde dehydrogenase family protein n=1 Tax=Microbacterium sp. STN6 TaxID=2995588 RepID=UPI002260C386|nr:aldehyde dehydrogenase family protein [Microbacterium sp. STN6]MCX7523137.1 aldehyde dehydrogenase family protein [Microbacterium sp. STN6]
MSLIHLMGTDAHDAPMTIVDPRDGSPVGAIESLTPLDIPPLVGRASDAFAWWSRVPPGERGAMLRHAASLVADRAPALARMNTRETGRPQDQALEGVNAAVQTLLQYAELGPLHRGESLRGPVDATDYSVPEPRGVVLVLTPWNDPVAVAAGLIGAAVVSGNTVIHKPSERCPHLGSLLGEVLAEAFPADVVQTAMGGSAVGNLLVEQPGVDVIAHVGSTRTGERIARAAALTGAHVIRENGGNDPLVVDQGVDPVWAAEQAALGAFANAGQLCTSVERIYVHERVADPFVLALVAEARHREETGELGPLVDRRLREAVHRQVSASVGQGAQVRAGAYVPDGAGSYYPATVLTECAPGMPVMTEETFGPVAPVQVVGGFDEALELAGRDRYGLAATVLTSSMENAQRAASELPFGTVKINDVFGGAPGGSAEPRRDSGSGYGYGPRLLDEMTTTKVVHLGLPA